MLKRMVVAAVLAGASACSANLERPRAVRPPSKSSELGVFMKAHMNPPFSKISFLLFHDGEGAAEVDAGDLPASANELARAAERLGRWPELPGESPQSKLVFSEYAESLKNDASNLIKALQDNRPDNARRVFESLHKKCDSCHHFFRYDESTSLTRPPEVAGTR